MSKKSPTRISIGSFSFMTRLSKRALRLYDEKELLIAKRDPYNNYRYYETGQFETALKIKIFSWLGFNLADIKEILSALEIMDDNMDGFEELFREKLKETRIEIQRLKEVEVILHDILQGKPINEVLLMKTTEPTIKEVPKIHVMSKRERGEIEAIGKIMGEIMGQIYHPDNQRGQVAIAGAPLLILHEYEFISSIKENEKDTYNPDFELAIPINGKIISEGKFDVKYLEPVKVISVIHIGPYNELEGAYLKILKYIENNGYRVAGPYREVYLNNPQEIPKNEILTEVQVPIK